MQPSACVLDVIDMGLESRTRPEGDVPIHGGSLEGLGKHRLLALGLFTWEVHHALICTSVARRVVLSHEMLREQVRHSDLADNLPVDDDRDGLTGTVIDVVAVLTRRLGTGVHLDLARA